MKSGFLTTLSADLKDSGNDCVWVVTKPLKYYSELLNCQICVPPWFETKEPDESGESTFFETDFASVPRVPIIYETWGNRAHREAVIHDYLFRIDSKPVVTYSQANNVFLEAMKSTGKSWYICYGMYWGVVLGAWTAFHKRRVKDKL